MTLADALSLVRRAIGIVWHLHEWQYDSEYAVISGVFVESRFCGIASCQRYEIRDPLTLCWVEHDTGYPGV